VTISFSKSILLQEGNSAVHIFADVAPVHCTLCT